MATKVKAPKKVKKTTRVQSIRDLEKCAKAEEAKLREEISHPQIFPPKIKTVNTWELESHRLPSRPDSGEVSYKFTTEHGVMHVKPSDIIAALEEQATSEETEITAPEADLQGWGVIHATDEMGTSRPLLLMRVLPAPAFSRPYDEVRGDDRAMEEIILREVYKLTPRKIKWLQFKARMKYWFMRLGRSKNKAPKPIKPPKTTAGWLSNLMYKD